MGVYESRTKNQHTLCKGENQACTSNELGQSLQLSQAQISLFGRESMRMRTPLSPAYFSKPKQWKAWLCVTSSTPAARVGIYHRLEMKCMPCRVEGLLSSVRLLSLSFATSSTSLDVLRRVSERKQKDFVVSYRHQLVVWSHPIENRVDARLSAVGILASENEPYEVRLVGNK